ncbi:MAG: Flp pilus assembly protein CpaB [Rhodospirillales bacterium]|nr:Flp pilus assembly protein CpaB [Rhodospirillales bacterium]
MALRITFFALMALGLLGLGAIAFVATHPAHPVVAANAQARPVTVRILVASRAIRAGTLLKPEDLTGRLIQAQQRRPSQSLDTDTIRRALVGSMVRRSLSPGEPIRRAELLRPGDHGFLAAVLKPGMRAVTVGVDDITGTAGLIWPGDKVDLILTENMTNPALSLGQRIVAETVLADVRVIAINQRLIEGAASGEAAHQVHTVTLEVTEAEAQKVQVAVRLGRLSLSVRSAQNVAENMPRHEPTWARDVSPALAAASHSPPGGVMNIWQGAAAAVEFKF